MHWRAPAVTIATALILIVALPWSATLAQSPAAAGCAPLVVAAQPAVPGGSAALGAVQPGPGPSVAPVTCWTGSIGQPLTSAALMTLGDAAYTADDAGNVIAFDAASGVERWRYALATDAGGQVRGIAPGDGLVYAAGPEGLVALEVADGSRAWRYRVKSDGLLIDADGFFWPIAVGDTVYGVTSSTDADGAVARAVVAIDAATGDERWSSALPDGARFGAPTSDGSLVLVPTAEGGLTALDAKTGTATWSAATGSPVTSAAIAGGVAFVGLGGGIVTARATTDGSEVWRSTMDSGAVTAITAVGDTVYVNGVLTVYALDAATGTERWRSTVQAGMAPFAFAVVPAVTSDTVYVGSADLDVVRIKALDATTGEPRWLLDTEMYGAVLASVASGGRLFIVAYDIMGSGGLLALGDPGA